MQTSKSEATKPERVRDWDSRRTESQREIETESQGVVETESRREVETESRRIGESERRRDGDVDSRRESRERDFENPNVDRERSGESRLERERWDFPQMLKTLGFWRLLEAQVQMGKPNNFRFNWFLSNWTTLFFGQKWSVQLDMDMVYSWTLGPFHIFHRKWFSDTVLYQDHRELVCLLFTVIWYANFKSPCSP